MRANSWLFCLVLLTPFPDWAAPPTDAIPKSAAQILDCGFKARWEVEALQVLDVQTHRFGKPARTFRLQIATKRVDGKTRFLGVFLAPPDERGTKLLTIENMDRVDDHFLYLPFLGRVKRIYGGRRQEPFLGTDFTFEDMEPLHATDFDATLRPNEKLEGHDYYVVSAVPRRESAYARSHFLVSRSDCQISEVRHFKRDAERPFKILSLPRSRMREVNGVLMPTWAMAKDIEAHRDTEVRFSEIQVGHDLDVHFFEPSILERLDGIPGLSRASAPAP
jgi:hypothetical protein